MDGFLERAIRRCFHFDRICVLDLCRMGLEYYKELIKSAQTDKRLWVHSNKGLIFSNRTTAYFTVMWNKNKALEAKGCNVYNDEYESYSSSMSSIE